MKEDRSRDIVFVLYILSVLLLAAIYFSVPERALFIENAINWWEEFWNVMKTFV